MTIPEVVEYVTGVTLDEISSPKRHADIAEARFILIYLYWKVEERTESYIGKIVNRDHSSVHYAITQMINLREKSVKQKVEKCIQYLNNNLHKN